MFIKRQEKSKLKIKSYLGFSIKSKQIIFGIDNVESSKIKPHLVIACKTLTENGKNQVLNYCRKNNITLVSPKDETLSDLVSRNNCKIVGLKNGNLSEAILNCKQEIEILYKG